MAYFSDCKTAEELKAAYRKFAKKLHPDQVGGSEAEFKAMKAAYEKAWERLKNVHASQAGGTYTATGDKATKETAADFMDIVDALLKFPGLVVELCGRWLWISGDTKAVKDDLKSLGCKWSPNKKMWSWHFPEDRKRGRKAWTMEQVRNFWGSETIGRAAADPDGAGGNTKNWDALNA